MVRKQLEEEIQQLQLAQEQLKGAQERYQDAMDTVSVMQSTQNEKGKLPSFIGFDFISLLF